MPDDLLAEVRETAAQSDLSQADVMRQSMKLGLPRLREQLNVQAGRVTNVDPLPNKVLKRIYSRPEEDDEPGVQAFMKAQAFGGED